VIISLKAGSIGLFYGEIRAIRGSGRKKALLPHIREEIVLISTTLFVIEPLDSPTIGSPWHATEHIADRHKGFMKG
jgi:hypothetical protein